MTPGERSRGRSGVQVQSRVNDALPFAVMVMIECGDVCNMTLSKAAMNIGMSNLVFIFYYNALGTILLLPLFILHSHRSKLPPLSFSLLCKFFFLGLIGIWLVAIFGYNGIKYSSPTLASAMSNLIPVSTFLLAIIFRMETFDFRRPSSQAKSLGTITAISGALVMILYEGPSFSFATPSSKLHHQLVLSQQSNWVLGGLFLGMTCLFASLWNIAQTTMVKEYPDETTIAFFTCLFGNIPCAVYSFIMESDPRAWLLQPPIKISAVVFAAIFVCVVRIPAVTWCLRKKGPVYVSMFKPTQMIVAVIVGFIVLGDALYLGSVIGGTLIAAGFYAVMWGIAKEKEMVVDSVCVMESSSQTTPLLSNNSLPSEK